MPPPLNCPSLESSNFTRHMYKHLIQMGLPTARFPVQKNISLSVLVLISILISTHRTDPYPYSNATQSGLQDTLLSLEELVVDGFFSFDNMSHAASDFGNRFHNLPLAVLHPKSVSDISSTIKHIFEMGPTSNLTVAARGNGHSLHGQALAPHGIVVAMQSLKQPAMRINTEEVPYVEVSGGELWINILQETLKFGLAPKSWTDYLHLTVGGTLSNGGISGQAFRHGPQVNNVYQLEVVTGKGQVFSCSKEQNPDLFYGVLGGLGQFGIITRASIQLEPAPKMVKWIRVLYLEFSTFSMDQEHLIESEDSFDYIEGSVIINRSGLLNNWRSSFRPRDPTLASKFSSDGKTLYCLEVALYFNPGEADNYTDQRAARLLSALNFIPSTLFLTEVSYVEFLDRVHLSEIKLREKGLWDVPHPWLNLLIPKSKIFEFAQGVFGKILKDNNNGPILIYPVNKSKWTNKTSFVTPDEDIFYLVAFLSSALPSSTGVNGLDRMLSQNHQILDFCAKASLKVKQYLPQYSSQQEWKAHFGLEWGTFLHRKSTYDPLSILAPGQRIFER